MDELTRDHGTQPLDGLMDRWNLTNHELVEVSTEQLNHKQVQKARKGRQLTLSLMQKLMRTLNDAVFLKLPKDQRPNFVPYLHKHHHSYFLQLVLKAVRADRDGWGTGSGKIGDRIRALRKRFQFKQAELAALAGVRKEAVALWENHHCRPGRDAFAKLAEFFGGELGDFQAG